MHYVDLLTGVPGPDVRHHVGRLLAAELAIGTLEAWRLAALVLVMPGHIALDSEAAAALGATVGLVVGHALRIGISRAAVRVVALTEVPIAAFGLEALAGLQHEVEIQLRSRRVEKTWNFVNRGGIFVTNLYSATLPSRGLR